ncbi:MAG: hypothetical protein IJG49_04205 [Erysipelotrichaceae bacterium]|nr:hypothetical protein [Erysipelotrichaceae bacterium]
MSEKKGLGRTIEKFVFLVKRKFRKDKLAMRGKPQYTVNQNNIFLQLKPGDIFLGKMPMSDSELYDVPDGHRHRPYLVIKKNKKNVTALQGSHRQYGRDKETFKIILPDFGQYNGETYFSTLETFEVPIENINKYISSLTDSQMSALQRMLTVQEKGSAKINSLDNVPVKFKMGDIVSDGKNTYLVTNDKDGVAKGYLLGKKTYRNGFSIMLNNEQYHADIYQYKILNGNNLELVTTLNKNRMTELHRFLSAGVFVKVGDIIKIGNEYFYVFKTYRDEIQTYPLSNKKSANTIKVNFGKKEMYLNPRKVVKFSNLRRDVVYYSGNEKLINYVNINRKNIKVKEDKKM